MKIVPALPALKGSSVPTDPPEADKLELTIINSLYAKIKMIPPPAPLLGSFPPYP